MYNVPSNVDILKKVYAVKIGLKWIEYRRDKLKLPLIWDLEENPLFLQFLGYWTFRGYYERTEVEFLGINEDIYPLLSALDYISETFKTSYVIKKDGAIRFRSAPLMHTMIALGFNNVKKKDKNFPEWLLSASTKVVTEFLRGFFIVAMEVEGDIIVCTSNNQEMRNIIVDLLEVHFNIVSVKLNEDKFTIEDLRSKQLFYEELGFLHERKSIALSKIV